MANYTRRAMDRVRFGRALGYGARHAAKTLAQAVDAATTPSATPCKPRVTAAKVRSRVAAAPETLRQASTQAKVAGRSVWSPVARFSSVLWLQVTGTFFLLIAAVFAGGLWKVRGAAQMGVHSAEGQRLYVFAAAFAVFTYFGVSNFVRAWRRERR
jgi:hypothetical protein